MVWILLSQRFTKRSEDLWKAQGTSLFNKPDTFIGKNWEYIEIPKGTTIPAGILIIEDDFNERFGATHYSIATDHAMSVDAFKLLLKQLMINVELQRGKQKNA